MATSSWHEDGTLRVIAIQTDLITVIERHLITLSQRDPAWVTEASPQGWAPTTRGERSNTIMYLHDALNARDCEFLLEHVEARQCLDVTILQAVFAPVMHSSKPGDTPKNLATVVLLDNWGRIVPKISQLLVEVVGPSALINTSHPSRLSHNLFARCCCTMRGLSTVTHPA